MTGSMLYFFTDMFLVTQIVCSIESWRQLVNNTFGIRINEMKWLLLNSTIYHRMVWISVTILWRFYVFLFFGKNFQRWFMNVFLKWKTLKGSRNRQWKHQRKDKVPKEFSFMLMVRGSFVVVVVVVTFRSFHPGIDAPRQWQSNHIHLSP